MGVHSLGFAELRTLKPLCQLAMRLGVVMIALLILATASCVGVGPLDVPISNSDKAIDIAKHAVGAVKVTRAEAKRMSWSQWQERSGSPGGPIPAPADDTALWVVGLKGTFTVIHTGGTVVVLNQHTGAMVLAETGPWDWPPYWNGL